MDFKKQKRAKIQVSSLAEKYPHDIQLYTDPPLTQISLSEFQELAMERLKVLRVLEQVNQKGGSKNFDDWKNAVIDELKRQGLKTYQKLVTGFGLGDSDFDYEARQRDHISHFILRFAYCQSEEYRRWFIARELELFKLRWSYLSVTGKQAFLKLNDMNYASLDDETCQYLATASNGFIKPGLMDYYCVRWLDVIDLVRSRKVYLEKGKAYITSSDLISVIGSTFRSNLSHTLVLMSHKLPIIQQDERIGRLVKYLHNTYLGKSYVVTDGKKHISLQSLDSLAKTSFPLCMKQLHTTLKTDHHLRHFGRQQYSLYLKGIGLSLDDAMMFWRTEFTKKMDVDQFEKRYAYNIRHNYGKEGKRTNYTPYSCIKIITSNVGPGDHHGCPFKHFDARSLKQTLTANNVSNHGVEEILNYMKQGHFQIACAKYFELTHNASVFSSTNHPNQYFEESQKIFAAGGPSNFHTANPRSQNQEAAHDTNDIFGNESINDSLFAQVDLENIEENISR